MPGRWSVVSAIVLLLIAPARGEPAASPKAPPARTDSAGDPLPEGALLRLGSFRFRDAGYLTGAALSPDGRTLAVATHQYVRLLDAATGKEVRRFPIQPTGMTDLSFSPDGRRLACSSHFGQVQLWDAATGTPLPAVGERTNQSSGCAFAADGKTVATGVEMMARDEKAVLHVWNVADGKERGRFEVLQNFQVRVALSPDGGTLATWGSYLSRGAFNQQAQQEMVQTIQLWNVATGKELRRLRLDSGMARVVTFAPDGKFLAAGDGWSSVSLVEVATGKVVRRFAGRRGAVSTLTFSPDGRVLAACGQDGISQLWDVATGRRRGLCTGPRCWISRLLFTPDGRALGWGIDGQTVRVWRVPSGEEMGSREGHHAAVTGVAFAADGKTLRSVGAERAVYRWDRQTGRQTGGLVLEEDERLGRPARSQVFAAFSPDGRYLAGGGPINGIRLWDAATGRALCDLADNHISAGLMRPPVFSPDSKVVGMGGHVGGQGQALRLYDTDSGEALKLPDVQASQVSALALSPGHRLLAAATTSFNRGVAYGLNVWDLATGKSLGAVGSGQATALAFSPDGRLLAYGTANGAVGIWDVERRQEAGALESAEGTGPYPLVFSPDGRTVAAGLSTPAGEQGRVVLWEVASGRVRRTFAGHAGQVTALAFAPDGRVLASGSQDTTVILWDLTGRSRRSGATAWDGEALWRDLADTRRAGDAIGALAEMPERAVALFRQRLHPAAKPDLTRVDKLLADLNSDRFATREKAAEELEQIGEPAEPALRKALADGPSLEVRRRLEDLLKKLGRRTPPADVLRELRAVEVLEQVGTSEAQALLGELAAGAPGARLTREAKETLGRLRGARH